MKKLIRRTKELVRRWPEYRKAIGGFLGVAIPMTGALVATGFFSGPQAQLIHDVLLKGAPLWAYFGVAISKKNAIPA